MKIVKEFLTDLGYVYVREGDKETFTDNDALNKEYSYYATMNNICGICGVGNTMDNALIDLYDKIILKAKAEKNKIICIE
jgi:hypothetical protein